MKSAITSKSSEASRTEERSQTRERKNEVIEILKDSAILKHPKQEKTFIVDLEDLDKVLNACLWKVEVDSKRGTYVRGKVGNRKISLHQFIFEGNGKPLDHINRDTLDNRKSNLRITNPVVNRVNSKDINYHLDKPVGIYFHKSKRVYVAQVQIEGKNKTICSVKSLLVAMVRYDEFMLNNSLPFVSLNCDLHKYSLQECLSVFGESFKIKFPNVFNRLS